MHNNTIKINLFQIKYIDYMSIKMGSVYELLKSIRKARNSPGRLGILVESTRTPPGILVGKYQDSVRNTRIPGRKHQESWYATRNLPGIHQESIRNPPGIHQESTRNPSGILVCNQDYQESSRNTWGSGKFWHTRLLELISHRKDQCLQGQ